MACSLDKIKSDSLNIVRQKIKGNAKSIEIKNDHAVFSYGPDFKIKKMEQAVKAAQNKQKKVEEWARDTFGEAFATGWTSLKTTPSSVKLDFKFPENLDKAYQRKIKADENRRVYDMEKNTASEFVYNGEIYPSLEDMQLAMEMDEDYFPKTSGVDNVNFNNYVVSKEVLLDKVNRRLGNLQATRKLDKSSNLNQEIKRVKDIKERLEEEIDVLKSDVENIYNNTLNTFDKDLELVEQLLQEDKPSIDNIHEAEHIIKYFTQITDYSADNDRDNEFIVNNFKPVSKELLDRLDEIRSKVTRLSTRITSVKRDYLVDVIDSSPQLKSMYPGKQVEEIRDIILEDKDDISFISQYFMTVDKQFTSADSMIAQMIRQELEQSRANSKATAAGFIERINRLTPKVRTSLKKLGYGLDFKVAGMKMFGDINFELYYQKTENGAKTGRLINKFSDKWFKNHAKNMEKYNNLFWSAWYKQDYDKADEALKGKYRWFTEHVDFLDISRVPEIIEDAELQEWSSHFNSQDAQQYRDAIISRIGKYNYEKLVAEQKEKLQDYKTAMESDIEEVMVQQGVSKFEDLDPSIQRTMKIRSIRNNPFLFLNSHFKNPADRKGMVDLNEHNSSNSFMAHMRYNSYFPKKERTVLDRMGNENTRDTGYFDADFEKIESLKEDNPELMEFWEVLNDATSFMNMTMSDASNILVQGSLPNQKRMFTDLLLDKDISKTKKMVMLLTNTKQFLKDAFSSSPQFESADEQSISKGNISSVQQDVNKRLKSYEFKYERIIGKTLKGNTKVNFDNQSAGSLQYFKELTGIEDTAELKNIMGAAFYPKKVIREFVTDSVMKEQSFNLPVVMRAYLDMVSEYKAQKDVQPKLSILKDLHESLNLPNKSDTSTLRGLKNSVSNQINRAGKNKGIKNKRNASNTRLDQWFRKNILNKSDKEQWLNISKYIGVKNYDKLEKEYKKEAEQQLVFLNELLEDPATKNGDEIQEQIKQIEETLANLGRDYTVAAAYNAVINRFAIFAGLAWNLPANVVNRYQGWYVGALNDTGKFWTAGNFYSANSFVAKKQLRRLPGYNKYKNEIKKTRLFINKLEILQDATNEIDRARNDSGFVGKIKKLSPFYITEYTEWHNQTPQILSMLMDEEITDKQGNTVKVFDGDGFPAHRIENGELVLKDEFATEENIADWQDFSSKKYAERKAKMSDTIAILNGDYSRTGSTYIKSKNVGKTLMTFKTWLPNQLYQRFASNQTNLALGKKNFDGFYTGGFKSSGTGAAASTMIAVTAAIAGGPVGVGVGLGVMGAQIAMMKGSGKSLQELKVMQQMASGGLAIMKKILALPTNSLMGKQVVKEHTFNELQVTEAEKENLKSIVNELVIMLGFVLAKVIVKGMLGNNDEEEPKYLDQNQKVLNPNYGTKERTEMEKGTYNFLENNITRMIKDMGMYSNPEEMFNTMNSTSIVQWFKKIQDIGTAYQKWEDGQDRLTTGPNKGESRLYNSVSKTFLPGIIQNWDSMKTLGFGKYTEKEFDNREYLDDIFYSDYKEDRMLIRSKRAALKAELEEYWAKEFELDKLEGIERKMAEEQIQKIISQEVNAEMPYPARYDYDDENQKRFD